MSRVICSENIASISELKSNPMSTVQSAKGMPLAILNRNQPVFYCVPAALYETMIKMLGDVELIKTYTKRASEPEAKVNINSV